MTFLTAKENRDVDLTFGLHWRGGARDWFMAGAFLSALRDHVTTDGVDLATLTPFRQVGTTNAWFARAGVSLLPFVPLQLAEGSSPTSELAGEVRTAIDVEHKNIAVPGEGSRKDYTAYFGLDARLVPDAWNPISGYLRFYGIAGVDTNGGWGTGLGFYGNGPLQFLSCNPGYSARPLTESLGDRVKVWSATCSLSGVDPILRRFSGSDKLMPCGSECVCLYLDSSPSSSPVVRVADNCTESNALLLL